MYRFNDCTDEDVTDEGAELHPGRATGDPDHHLRPAGTPMPAWGIEGGGPKNDQAISDIVAYLKSIQLSPAKAKAQVLENVAELKTQAKEASATAEDNLAAAQKALLAGDAQGS